MLSNTEGLDPSHRAAPWPTCGPPRHLPSGLARLPTPVCRGENCRGTEDAAAAALSRGPGSTRAGRALAHARAHKGQSADEAGGGVRHVSRAGSGQRDALPLRQRGWPPRGPRAPAERSGRWPGPQHLRPCTHASPQRGREAAGRLETPRAVCVSGETACLSPPGSAGCALRPGEQGPAPHCRRRSWRRRVPQPRHLSDKAARAAPLEREKEPTTYRQEDAPPESARLTLSGPGPLDPREPAKNWSPGTRSLEQRHRAPREKQRLGEGHGGKGAGHRDARVADATR